MTTATRRRALTRAEKLDRRERMVLKRIEAFESACPFDRREFAIEILEMAVRDLARVAPDGKRPKIPHVWANAPGYEEARRAACEYDQAREEILRYRMILEAVNAWAAQRDG